MSAEECTSRALLGEVHFGHHGDCGIVPGKRFSDVKITGGRTCQPFQNSLADSKPRPTIMRLQWVQFDSSLFSL